MPDPIDPADRLPVLLRLRDVKMARSAHAYVRGSTAAFYAWLASPTVADLPIGPPIWICGDCHVGNLGPIGSRDGATAIEIRDLDQTVIGNPANDLVRLALSLAMAARASSLPGVTTARMTEFLVAGYEAAFAGELPSESADELPPPVGIVMRRAIRRTRRMLMDQRLGGGKRRRFKLGRRFWPLSAEERAAVERLVASDAVRHLVATLESLGEDGDEGQVELVDAAYWVKGCSSLGSWRGAALVEARTGGKKSGRRTTCLLDLKEAVAAVAPALAENPFVASPAERVVTGARHLAPALGARMIPAKVLDHAVVIRELLPQDLKVELDALDVEDARSVAYYLGSVLGGAHGRQLHGPARAAWQTELQSRRGKTLDAPSWLWRAVVDLVGIHERAYLEHCRRYVLALAKTE